MQITPGRTVYYQSHGSRDRTTYQPGSCVAVVLEVGAWITDEVVDAGLNQRTLLQHWDPTSCLLRVSTATGEFTNTVPYDPEGAPGTWQWPHLVNVAEAEE